MVNKEKIVRKIANTVRNRYHLKLPTDFKVVFREKDIKYVEQSFETKGDGYSDLKNGQLKVVINSDMAYIPRKRFTIAHELGHIFIGWHDDVTICQTDNEYSMHNKLDIQEKEANVFASELLMPTDWVKEEIRQYGPQGLDVLIKKLSELANTSTMAVFYALGNAFSSGNVLIVYSDNITYGMKFVAEKTMEVHLREIDFTESCMEFSKEKLQYRIGPYLVDYYKFCKFPGEEKVLTYYLDHQRNLFETLMLLSENNLLSILHCIKSILDVVPDNYIICLYDDEELLMQIKSEGFETVVGYDVAIYEIEGFCLENDYDYWRKDIEKGYEIIIVKERFYKDPEYWRQLDVESKLLFNDILFDLYNDNNIDKKRNTINGIIGAANSHRKFKDSQQIYDLLYKKMNRPELCEFVNHEDFNKFLSMKAYELFYR